MNQSNIIFCCEFGTLTLIFMSGDLKIIADTEKSEFNPKYE